ncbi:HYR domain-containing protein, partial [Saprospiraceae bacterium]|nr:HYR domain-containing protein [Saprospiraceae bacterium]
MDGVPYTLTTPLSPGYSQAGVAPTYTVRRSGGVTPHGNGDFVWESNSTATGIRFITNSSGNPGYFLELSPDCPTTSEGSSTEVSFTNDFDGMLPDDCDGNVMVTFTATDNCGNTSTCIAEILMDDTTDPFFVNCPPADLTVNVDVDECGSNPIFSTPIADDNCNVTVMQTSGFMSGAEFPLGTTPVSFTATDGCDNTAVCSFNIIVVDSDVPSISCPSNDVVQCNDAGTCTWMSDDSTDPIYNDNCPGLSVTYTITGATTATGNTNQINTVDGDNVVFNIGTSEVCYTITDPSGNSSSCCFDVVIEDCEAPTINCPSDLIVECEESSTVAGASGQLEWDHNGNFGQSYAGN